ncbi:hypothetical protein [Streptomyces sp. NRRL S-337]|uniref:hypothetical protein n=1 Tax=Streptomyces sp. NRRL S-337 TaxID=1463900 RepID=UPI0004CAC5A2|nr:hypothetical protein [Streptomyces sp. NRRL S-337]
MLVFYGWFSIENRQDPFAVEVDDPLGDVVVAALVMAAEQQAGRSATLLGELAESVPELVAMAAHRRGARARGPGCESR